MLEPRPPDAFLPACGCPAAAQVSTDVSVFVAVADAFYYSSRD